MARRLNCWIVAMWIWLRGRGFQYAWIRRSHSFKRMLPHFGYAERSGLRYFRSIEYRPPKNRKWTRDDIVFLFNGYYAVVHYRVFHVSRHATMAEALKAYYFGER